MPLPTSGGTQSSATASALASLPNAQQPAAPTGLGFIRADAAAAAADSAITPKPTTASGGDQQSTVAPAPSRLPNAQQPAASRLQQLQTAQPALKLAVQKGGRVNATAAETPVSMPQPLNSTAAAVAAAAEHSPAITQTAAPLASGISANCFSAPVPSFPVSAHAQGADSQMHTMVPQLSTAVLANADNGSIFYGANARPSDTQTPATHLSKGAALSSAVEAVNGSSVPQPGPFDDAIAQRSSSHDSDTLSDNSLPRTEIAMRNRQHQLPAEGMSKAFHQLSPEHRSNATISNVQASDGPGAPCLLLSTWQLNVPRIPRQSPAASHCCLLH